MTYNYVHVEVIDTYGISRGLIISKEHFDRNSVRGIPLAMCGAVAMTPRGELVGSTGTELAIGYSDSFFYPDLATLKTLPWSNDYASVFGDFRMKANDGTSDHVPACSRGILKNALEKLNTMGLSIYGSYEYEFYLYDLATMKPLADNINFMLTSEQSKYEPLAKDIMDTMKKLKISPEGFSFEYGHGQFECTYSPSYGIDIADNATRFKKIVKEVSRRHGFYASFMSKPDIKDLGSSAHLNHSLWNNKGENMFYDVKDDLNISELARYWLAGLQYHYKALVGLGGSNINCFNRFKAPFVPHSNVWGLDNRTVCYRVKNIDKERTYLESRYTGAATNPYLALAATIYAGIDGIERKLELQQSKPFQGDGGQIKPGSENCPEGILTAPATFKEAMQCLNENEMFCKVLGEKFLKCFNALRNHEISKYNENVACGTQWEWQKLQYFKYF